MIPVFVWISPFVWFLCYSATGFGDPHMVTLDSVEYTFNGYGEFTVLKVKNTNFVLQARMAPLSTEASGHSRATVYTAFVSKEDGSDTVQVGRKLWQWLLFKTMSWRPINNSGASLRGRQILMHKCMTFKPGSHVKQAQSQPVHTVKFVQASTSNENFSIPCACSCACFTCVNRALVYIGLPDIT